MTTTTESRAGFTPAPPSSLEIDTQRDGGGFSSDQAAAQRRLLARPVAREPKRCDAEWGRG